MHDLAEYIHSAAEIEALARDLGEDEVDPILAVERILFATQGRVLALRRAHRHCELEVTEGTSTSEGLVRAFFYLSAARIRTEGYHWPREEFHETT